MARKKPVRKDDSHPLLAQDLPGSDNRFEAKAKLSREVAAQLLLPQIKAFEVELAEPKELARFSDEPIAPVRGQWFGGDIRPQKTMAAGRFRTGVRYRGHELEPLWVLGADDRRTYSDTRYPWGCVCKINTSAGSGSGVIVGPRHVLTASHVVNWSVSNGVNGSVDVHRAGGAVSMTTAITHVHAFTRVTGTVSWSELDEDYAVLVTAARIGDIFGWFGARTYNSSWDRDRYWFNIGYPGDVAGGNFPIYQDRRWLDEHAWDFGGGRAMDTDADTFFGQSGGPMAAFWSDGPYVVSVVSAQSRSGARENYCSGGGDLPRLVRRALSRHP
jgi:V8-like Glu-specific endopeptidase